MANTPSAAYWIGTDGHTYVRAAGVNGVQDYGILPKGSTIAGAQQIDDPVNPTRPASGGGVDTQGFNQTIDATQAQINDLTPAYNSLLTSAGNTYQSTINDLGQRRAEADKVYGDNKTSSAREYNTAKNVIRTNTGNTIRGIDTMIGSHGGGGQSAGDYAALLAGKAGTSQLGDAGVNFGKNEQSLDTAHANFITGYNTNVTNAGLQRDADVNAANANIQTQKANLLQRLATLFNERAAASGRSGVAESQPLIDESKRLLSSAAAVGAPRVIPAQTPSVYTPPALDSYTTNPTAVTQGGNSAANDTVQPFYATLFNRGKQLQAA